MNGELEGKVKKKEDSLHSPQMQILGGWWAIEEASP